MTPANAEAALGENFVITRTFAAPRERVFRAWTDRDELQSWFGPKGFTTEVLAFDLRVGGRLFYHMHNSAGAEMWGIWIFREITAPSRLVFVQSFANAAGEIIRAPFFKDWPREMLTTLEFAETAGRTTLAMTSAPIQPTDQERAAFRGAFGSMQQGWGGTLDLLADYLR